jgi:acyl phosphate:glycerol-3-phosphate acyltransferase
VVVSAALAVVLAYVVGAVPIGVLVARAFGIGDLQRQGSGNIGATNVLRTAGRLPAILTLAGDIAKGYTAAAMAAFAPEPPVAAACAVAAVAGNCWSVFLGFRGGKGVATGLGALLRLVPVAVVPAAVVWLVVTVVSGFVSLGSVLAAACVPLGALLLGYPASAVLAAVAVAVIVVVRHRENIARLLAGTERSVSARRPA